MQRSNECRTGNTRKTFQLSLNFINFKISFLVYLGDKAIGLAKKNLCSIIKWPVKYRFLVSFVTRMAIISEKLRNQNSFFSVILKFRRSSSQLPTNCIIFPQIIIAHQLLSIIHIHPIPLFSPTTRTTSTLISLRIQRATISPHARVNLFSFQNRHYTRYTYYVGKLVNSNKNYRRSYLG